MTYVLPHLWILAPNLIYTHLDVRLYPKVIEAGMNIERNHVGGGEEGALERMIVGHRRHQGGNGESGG